MVQDSWHRVIPQSNISVVVRSSLKASRSGTLCAMEEASQNNGLIPLVCDTLRSGQVDLMVGHSCANLRRASVPTKTDKCVALTLPEHGSKCGHNLQVTLRMQANSTYYIALEGLMDSEDGGGSLAMEAVHKDVSQCTPQACSCPSSPAGKREGGYMCT